MRDLSAVAREIVTQLGLPPRFRGLQSTLLAALEAERRATVEACVESVRTMPCVTFWNGAVIQSRPTPLEGAVDRDKTIAVIRALAPEGMP